MRHSLIIAMPLIAILVGCQAAEESSSQAISSEAAENDAVESKESTNFQTRMGNSSGAVFSNPPVISPKVAPGVAFHYRYDFRVAGSKIELVQDEHAAACETLGTTRCQITGLSFAQSSHGAPVGRMEFLLDPAIARKFGRDAIASVEKAEGVLATSNISGENVGADITSSQVRSSGMESEVKRIETRLANKGLADIERTELRRRAEELRAVLGSEQEERRNGEQRIATTPVQFHYSGDPNSGVFNEALTASSASLAMMLSFLLMFAGVLLPWLLPVAAFILLVKSPLGIGLRRWWNRNPPLVDENSG